MPDYRLYFFVNGHIYRRDEFEARDDTAAVEHARTLRGAERSELWCGARKLCMFDVERPA